MSTSAPASLCDFFAKFKSANGECNSRAFSRLARTTRALRASIFFSNTGNARSIPSAAPNVRTPRAKHLANNTASATAWLAPCALNGVMGCAASPINVTLLCISFTGSRSVRGSKGSRSYTGYPAMFASSVRSSMDGTGSCHVPHNSRILCFNEAGSFENRTASASEAGNESCHIVESAVNGMA